MQFEAQADYLGRTVTIKADSFADLHQALAGVAELNKDFRHVAQLEGVNPRKVVPAYRVDAEGNEYFGVQDVASGQNVTFGRKREKAAIPFFPKGAEGFYDPRTGRRGRSGRQPQPDPPASDNSMDPLFSSPALQQGRG